MYTKICTSNLFLKCGLWVCKRASLKLNSSHTVSMCTEGPERCGTYLQLLIMSTSYSKAESVFAFVQYSDFLKPEKFSVVGRSSVTLNGCSSALYDDCNCTICKVWTWVFLYSTRFMKPSFNSLKQSRTSLNDWACIHCKIAGRVYKLLGYISHEGPKRVIAQSLSTPDYYSGWPTSTPGKNTRTVK